MNFIYVPNAILFGALIAASLLTLVGSPPASAAVRPQTFCNPLDLPYCFRESLPSNREAADPAILIFKGEYWLFASKSEGYCHSKDFIHWLLVIPTGLPIDQYAPGIVEIAGKLYWNACNTGIYETDDPAAGVWQHVSDTGNHGDPDLFRDDGGRVYLYSGLSSGGSIGGQELDPNNGFKPLTDWISLFSSDVAHYGSQIAGEPTDVAPYKDSGSWLEGSWMTKHDGKYYLQYAAPGTQWKTYNDGVFVSDHPLGPFTFAPYSPFSFKPTGFICGAGHSTTFQDFGGRYWHAVTMTISVRAMFERRLGLFPTWFDIDGQMVCNTYLGDYPQFAPGVVTDPSNGNSPGWMLLSYHKPATASSTLDGHPISAAFDEDIRTWWSAATSNPGEWLQVDLGKIVRVEAAQVNFADQGSSQVNRMSDGYGYKLDISRDGKAWTTIVDRGVDMRDSPHDYTQLDQALLGRYVRITNTHSPGGGLFSISGLRIFGNGLGKAPARAVDLYVNRDAGDPRQATLAWKPVDNADGYIVRYGIAATKLFNNYQVYGAATLHMHTLNVGVPYYFTVVTFNDSGITKGSKIELAH
jgi:hypothetical protein